MICLENLSVTYDGRTAALRTVNLQLVRGEFAVVLGSSGAGKSTLLRCINLLTRPSTGRVIVEGLGDISHPQRLREHRKQTGMIFQQHQLIGRQTVLKNVLMGRLAYHSSWRIFLPRRDRYIALDSIERVGLIDKALSLVSTLSGGQQQRVGIARSLAQKPQLILADEPVASLDPASASQVLSLLRKICQEDGITALVSLHQVELAQQYADRIIGLANGQIVFDGTPKQMVPQLDQIYQNSSAIAD